MSSATSRRRELVTLAILGLVLGGTLAVVALRPGSRTAWIVALAALANVMVAALLRRARAAA